MDDGDLLMGANNQTALAALQHLIDRWSRGASASAQGNVAKLTRHRDRWLEKQAVADAAKQPANPVAKRSRRK